MSGITAEDRLAHIRLDLGAAFARAIFYQRDQAALKAEAEATKPARMTRAQAAYWQGFYDASMTEIWEERTTYGYLVGGVLYSAREAQGVPWKHINELFPAGDDRPRSVVLRGAVSGYFWRATGKPFRLNPVGSGQPAAPSEAKGA